MRAKTLNTTDSGYGDTGFEIESGSPRVEEGPTGLEWVKLGHRSGRGGAKATISLRIRGGTTGRIVVILVIIMSSNWIKSRPNLLCV